MEYYGLLYMIKFLFLLPTVVYFLSSMVLLSRYLKRKKSVSVDGSFTPPVSVVITSRNEEKNVGDCLEAMTRQEYPKNKYEVIIVDDSSDNTYEIVKKYAKKYKFIKGEKQKGNSRIEALEQGIKRAKNEILFFTDADCVPGPRWLLKTVQKFKDEKTTVVCGEDRLLGNSLKVRIDRFYHAVLDMYMYFFIEREGSFAAGCGTNLAFKKKAFYKVGGYKGIKSVYSRSGHCGSGRRQGSKKK